MSEWLRYPENKPKESIWCVVCCIKNGGLAMHYRIAMYRIDQDVFLAWPILEHERACYEVTHYMPLPEPPKETE